MDNRAIFKPLYAGKYYHIYNRGNNRETIFKGKDNYTYFLSLWKKYITPHADTFCYCLLPNHFHFFIRVKEDGLIEKALAKQFSNMFNAYAKAFNKKYNRTGSLFQERFRRKEITDQSYYTAIIGYILTNAVRHKLCEAAREYPYSAYCALLSNKTTLLIRDEVLSWFGSRKALMRYIEDYEKELQTC